MMNLKQLSYFVAITIIPAVATACGGGRQPESPAPTAATDSVVWNGDVDLAPLLIRPELNALEMGAADRVEARLGRSDFVERLGFAAEDSTAPWLVRVNALKLLANRGATGQLPVFAVALQARDERVRIAAVAAMREFLTLRPSAAVDILAYALRDQSPRVQTAALQMLADRNVGVLRDFLKRVQNREVRAITLDLIRAAEERGAPLAAKDSSGTLERTNANGAVLTFTPTRRWPEWDAAVGNVTATLPEGRPLLVAQGVEEVGHVVPAFFSRDGKTIVYEVNREIHVRDLVTGADRKLADGIAPRILPFTDDFIYFAEVRSKRSDNINSFGLKYDVMRMPLAGGTAATLGQINAKALNDLKGNYSTVRWTRIQESEGSFELVGELMEPFSLPSPFAGK